MTSLGLKNKTKKVAFCLRMLGGTILKESKTNNSIYYNLHDVRSVGKFVGNLTKVLCSQVPTTHSQEKSGGEPV